jgi:glycosyltransferase involved in cell wall biosynthesis
MAKSTPWVRLILVGDRAHVPGLLPAFDVFALPSSYEEQPTAMVEAMASGGTVVATAVNAVADVVIPGRTGVLVPPAWSRLRAEALRSAYATGLAPITVSSANWPSPTHG